MPPRSPRLSGNAGPGESTLVIRNVTVLERRTSVRLEPEVWEALNDIAARQKVTVHFLCTEIARRKPGAASLTAAIRVLVVYYFRLAATEEGHIRAGHGGKTELMLDEVFQDRPPPPPSPRKRKPRTPRTPA